MAGAVRESSFMPTVKCSTCSRQVEISLMGEHLCSGAPAPEGMALLTSVSTDQAGTLLTLSTAAPSMLAPSLFGRLNPFAASSTDKQSRMPPEVDTSAASMHLHVRKVTVSDTDIGTDRAYNGQGQLTPVSGSSGSRSVSPKTPIGRPGAGRTDDYFAPQIANDSPPPEQPRRPGGYGGFGDGEGFEDSMYPPGSPKKQQPNLLDRINTIVPDPFDSARRRPSAAGRNGSINSDRPGTSSSSLSSRAPRKNGYGGFGPPNTRQDLAPEPLGMLNRSETFPRPSETVEPPLRTPSEPGLRPDKWRRPSETSQDTNLQSRRPSRGPDTSRPPPPRTSLVRPRTSGQDGAPAVPSINFAEEFGVGNPYHVPSASTSSSASGYSQPDRRPSMAGQRARTSPPRTLASRSKRNPSNTSSFDNLMSDLQSFGKEVAPSTLQPPSKDVKAKPRPPPLQASRGYDPRIDPIIQSGRRPVSPLAPSAADRQFGGDAPFPGRSRDLSPVSPLTPTPPSPPPPRGSPERSRDRSAFKPENQLRSRSRSRPRDGSIQSSRGDCKACMLPITGKSISSADGRLTGRYHKACFVCSTCQEPFSSSTFYVLEDRPYCHRHYHELNGSLCGSCDKGIEGQYLEDESTKKHHVGCFKCRDCGMALRDGYFEVNGASYCEKDAWRRVQQPWMANGGARKPPLGQTLGLPPGPRAGGFGLPAGKRIGPRPRMEKRMTRLGMM